MKKCDSRKRFGKGPKRMWEEHWSWIERLSGWAKLQIETEDTNSNNQEINLTGLPNTRTKRPEHIDN